MKREGEGARREQHRFCVEGGEVLQCREHPREKDVL